MTTNTSAQTAATGARAYAAKKSIKDDLDNIGRKYRLPQEDVELPKSQGLERINPAAPGDDDLASLAANKLADYYMSGRAAITEDADNNTANLGKSKDALAESAKKRELQLGELYAAAKESTSNEALKRGLARSSIVSNQLYGLETDKIRELSEGNTEYDKELRRIDDDINAMTAKKAKALAEFDISYAAKLALEISGLREARDEKALEALKYNNSIAEKEAQYEADRRLDEQRLAKGEYELLSERSKAAVDADRQKAAAAEAYRYIADYLDGLGKEDALYEFLNNDDIRANVSEEQFKELYAKIKSRKE
jgi:hypothetical protein